MKSVNKSYLFYVLISTLLFATIAFANQFNNARAITINAANEPIRINGRIEKPRDTDYFKINIPKNGLIIIGVTGNCKLARTTLYSKKTATITAGTPHFSHNVYKDSAPYYVSVYSDKACDYTLIVNFKDYQR